MQIVIQKFIFPAKLGKELIAAGIPHNGMSRFGDVLEILLVDETQSSQVEAVIDAHDGINSITERHDAAERQVRNIPGWATWSEADALAWWNANLSDAQVDAIGNLADAESMLKKQNAGFKAMARLLIAIRDRLFPGLPEE